MSKLKTLKDILDIEDYEDKVIIKMLRSEAIKWVKNIKSGKSYFCDEFSQGQSAILIHFFNITEEEIKDENNKRNNK